MEARKEEDYSLADPLMLQKIQRRVQRTEKKEYEIRSRIFWSNLFPHHHVSPRIRETKTTGTSSYPAPRRTTASQTGYERSVIVKISFKTFNKNSFNEATKTRIATNTAECIEYLMRFEDKKAFDAKRDEIEKKDLLEAFKGDAVFKIMISPEEPEVLTPDYIRKTVSAIESHTKKKLKWAAVFHDNTNHPHAHIIISRTSGDDLSWENPLVLDRNFISRGLRERCQDLSTQILGKKTIQEYKLSFLETLKSKGLSKIDHIISGSPNKRESGLFIPSSEDYYILSRTRLQKLPTWKQEIVEKRLEFLSENTDTGFIYEGGYWKCYKPLTWMNELLNEAKRDPFRNIEKEYGSKIEVVSSSGVKDKITGKVIAHSIVDDNAEKVGIVVRTDENRLFYAETNMSFASAESVNGKTADITPKDSKDRRYRITEVKIHDDTVSPGRTR